MAGSKPVAELTVDELRAVIADALASTPRPRSVLTRDDILADLRRSRTWWKRLEQRQRALGVALLPREIEGMPHCYRRAEVERWLKVGLPGVIDGRRRRHASESAAGLM